jgi:hypothetical protein
MQAALATNIFLLGQAVVILFNIVVSLTCTAYLYWAFIEEENELEN